jgi:hypothetical protein
MTVKKYFQTVLDTLQGKTQGLKAVPQDRLDWAGSGALLDLFHETSGEDRSQLIRAIGQVIDKHAGPRALIAQLIHIASSLDLAEVEPQVRALRSKSFALQEPIKSAITNYLAFRQLKTTAESKPFRPTRATKNGNAKSPKKSRVK